MMPVSALWALVGGFALLAFGLALKVAEISHRLKRSDDEALRFESKIDALKKTHDKEISNIKELHKRKVEELTDNITKLTHKDDSLPELSDEDIEILRFVSINKLIGGPYMSIDRADMCRKAKLSNQQLQYRLDRLGAAGYLQPNLEGGICGISPEGRELLFEKGLLL